MADSARHKANHILALFEQPFDEIAIRQLYHETAELQRDGEFGDAVMKLVLEAIPLPTLLERLGSRECYHTQFAYLQLLILAVNSRPMALACTKVEGVWELLSEILTQDCYESDVVQTLHHSGKLMMMNQNHRIQEGIFFVIATFARNMPRAKYGDFFVSGLFEKCVSVAQEKLDLLHDPLHHIAACFLALSKNDPEVIESIENAGYVIQLSANESKAISDHDQI